MTRAGLTTSLAAIPVLALLAGCGTLTREPIQVLQVEAVDAHDRPVAGLTCRIGDDATTFTLPADDVRVRRSALKLEIDCRRGAEIAQATVVPRREGLEQALVPFGSVAVLVDHFSGKLYDYPTILRLRLGEHVTLEHGGQARIAKSENLPGATTVALQAPIAAPAPAPAHPAAVKAHAATTVAARAKPTPRPAPAAAPLPRIIAAADPAVVAAPARSAPATW